MSKRKLVKRFTLADMEEAFEAGYALCVHHEYDGGGGNPPPESVKELLKKEKS